MDVSQLETPIKKRKLVQSNHINSYNRLNCTEYFIPYKIFKYWYAYSVNRLIRPTPPTVLLMRFDCTCINDCSTVYYRYSIYNLNSLKKKWASSCCMLYISSIRSSLLLGGIRQCAECCGVCHRASPKPQGWRKTGCAAGVRAIFLGLVQLGICSMDPSSRTRYRVHCKTGWPGPLDRRSEVSLARPGLTLVNRNWSARPFCEGSFLQKSTKLCRRPVLRARWWW